MLIEQRSKQRYVKGVRIISRDVNENLALKFVYKHVLLPR